MTDGSGGVRIFLDANILFSGAKSAGAVRELLVRARSGGHQLCADAYVVAEARRNLGIKEPSAIAALEGLLGGIEVSPHTPGVLPPEVTALLPDKDQPVLAAAVRMGCDALVTGDRTHFGALYGTVTLGVKIYSPRGLAEALGLANLS